MPAPLRKGTTENFEIVERMIREGSDTATIKIKMRGILSTATIENYASIARKNLGLASTTSVGSSLASRGVTLPEPVLAYFKLEAEERGTTYASLVSMLLSIVAQDAMIESILDGVLPRFKSPPRR